MQQKKIPLRRCSGCGESKPKKELIRVVRTPEGSVELDLTGKKNGRGAYLCRSADCLKKAEKAKRFDRAFETQVPPEVYEALRKELTALE